MGLLKDTAICIIHDTGAVFEDKIEAYQFMNDNFLLDSLTERQKAEFNILVEGGEIQTAPWRNWES